MHNKIIQIDTKKIEGANFITPEDYYCDHWFVGAIADYVAEVECINSEAVSFLNAIVKCIPSAKTGYDSMIFGEGFKEEFFARRFELLKSRLNEMTLKEFSTRSVDVFDFICIADDKYGYYVDSPDFGLVTLDRFIRYAQPNTTYYIGGIVDYHF